MPLQALPSSVLVKTELTVSTKVRCGCCCRRRQHRDAMDVGIGDGAVLVDALPGGAVVAAAPERRLPRRRTRPARCPTGSTQIVRMRGRLTPSAELRDLRRQPLPLRAAIGRAEHDGARGRAGAGIDVGRVDGSIAIDHTAMPFIGEFDEREVRAAVRADAEAGIGAGENHAADRCGCTARLRTTPSNSIASLRPEAVPGRAVVDAAQECPGSPSQPESCLASPVLLCLQACPP